MPHKGVPLGSILAYHAHQSAQRISLICDALPGAATVKIVCGDDQSDVLHSRGTGVAVENRVATGHPPLDGTA